MIVGCDRTYKLVQPGGAYLRKLYKLLAQATT